VQFALALNEYDVLKHQPHPPGYILYVVLGRIVNAWLHDPTASYVALAVAFSGLTTFVVYYLARAVYDRTTALAAAALLAVSPLFWFYSSVGLTYAGEALFASTVAYFGFRALNGSRSDAYLAAWYLGIAGGMRQSLLVLLFPLWIGCVALGVRRLRVVLVGLGILTASVLTWFVPMIWLTGGLERYVAASAEIRSSSRSARSRQRASWPSGMFGAGAGPPGSGSCSAGRSRRSSSTRSCTSGKRATS